LPGKKPCVRFLLLGVLAGQMLVSDRTTTSKVYRLLEAGAVSLAGGLVCSLLFPVIKLMRTSSYVLVSGSLNFMAFALPYRIIDMLGHTK
jgi:predicted acyltransferase